MLAFLLVAQLRCKRVVCFMEIKKFKKTKKTNSLSFWSTVFSPLSNNKYDMINKFNLHGHLASYETSQVVKVLVSCVNNN